MKIELKNIPLIVLMGLLMSFEGLNGIQRPHVDVAVPVIYAVNRSSSEHLRDLMGQCPSVYASHALWIELQHWSCVPHKQVHLFLDDFYRGIDVKVLMSLAAIPVIIIPTYVRLLEALYGLYDPCRMVPQSPAVAQAMRLIADLITSDALVPIRPWKKVCDEIIVLLEQETDLDAQAFVQTLRSIRESTWPSVIGWYLSYHTEFITKNMTCAGIKVPFNTDVMWTRLAMSLAAQ